MSLDAEQNDEKKTPRKSLREQTVEGFGWRIVTVAGNFLSNFVIGVVLARLLTPEDFGLVGLALIVIGFGKLFANLGIGPALIQRHEITERHLRVGFTLSFLMGVVMTAAVYLSAPLIARFMNEARLVDILHVLSFVFLVSTLKIVSLALLNRELDFRRIMITELVSYGVGYGALGIVLAVMGFGVWSLVWGSLVQNVLETVLAYAMVRHTLKPLVAKRELKELASFGAGISAASVVNYVALQGDYIIVGRVLGPSALGVYNRAYNLMKISLNYFVKALSKVLFPAASKVQHEAERFKRAYLMSLTFTNFVSIPCMIVVALLAHEIVVGIYGPQWVGAVVPLQILAVAGIFRAEYNNVASFLQAKGKVYRILAAQIVYAACIIGGGLIAVRVGGLPGVAFAVGASIVVMWGMMTTFANRATGTSLAQFARARAPGLILALPMALACYGTKRLVSSATDVNLIVLVASALVTAIVGLVLLLVVPSEHLQGVPHQILRLSDPLLRKPWVRRVTSALGVNALVR